MTETYIIYKIYCYDDNIKDCYVGSSKAFRQRKCDHKYICNNETHKKHNEPKYKFIRDNGGWDNWNIVAIEEYKCNNIIQARIREQHWIEQLNATLNKHTAYGKDIEKKKEWEKNNQDKLLSYRLKYEEKNRDLINQKALERYHANKVEINNRRNKHKNTNDKI